MKKLIIISSSLNKDSMSFIWLQKVKEIAIEKWFDTDLIDLRKVNMPFCDSRKMEEYSEEIQQIAKKLDETDYIVFWTPVYCYSLSGVLKNFIDIFAKFMTWKKFWVFEQAWTKLSYLAVSDLQKIVWFECESQPIFPVILTDYSSYKNWSLTDIKSIEKIDDMLNNFLK